MTRKERVVSQIEHRQSDFVPQAGLDCEGDVAEMLDRHFGSGEWRGALDRANHIVRIPGLPLHGVEADTGAAFFTDAFGTRWRGDLRPFHLEEPGLREPSFEAFRFPVASDFFAPGWQDAALEQISAGEDRFMVTGFGFGLFERSWAIRSFQGALTDAVLEPEFYAELVQRITELQLALLDEILTLPIDGFMFSDDWGDQRGVLLGPERWRKFIKPGQARLYERVHDAGKYTLNHCCGNVVDIMPDLIEIGLDVLQSVQPEAMDPYELKRRFGRDITFWGGLGSQRVIPFGTPEEIHAEVRRLAREMGAGGGYILGPAKSLQPGTPVANAAAVVEAFLAVAGDARVAG
jgi:uroporphyrinogen decarboxylase